MDMPFRNISDQDFYELFSRHGDTAYDEDGEWTYLYGAWYLTAQHEKGEWAYVNGEWTFGEWFYLSSIGWKFEPRHTDQVYNPLDYPLIDDYDDPADL